VALDQQYTTDDEFQEVYEHAGRIRAAIRDFINYLVSYNRRRWAHAKSCYFDVSHEKGQHNQGIPEHCAPVQYNPELLNL
jgi:hypothetical protein